MDNIEILPLTVVAQAFPARPSSLPDVRDFVRRQLTSTPISDEGVRSLCERVADVLLDAAGVSGTIQVSLRIFRAAAEVDVLFSPADGQDRDNQDRDGRDRDARTRDGRDRDGRDRDGRDHDARDRDGQNRDARAAPPAIDRGARIAPLRKEPAPGDSVPPSFAAWLAVRLRAEGLTMEAAARRLDVSTKTISRWVAGSTEPRLRDLYRIRDVFGEPPFR